MQFGRGRAATIVHPAIYAGRRRTLAATILHDGQYDATLLYLHNGTFLEGGAVGASRSRGAQPCHDRRHLTRVESNAFSNRAHAFRDAAHHTAIHNNLYMT